MTSRLGEEPAVWRKVIANFFACLGPDSNPGRIEKQQAANGLTLIKQLKTCKAFSKGAVENVVGRLQ